MVTDEYFVKIPLLHGRKYWQHSLLASLSSSEWLNQAAPRMSDVFSDLFFLDLEILVLFSLVPVSGRLVIISQLLSVPCTGTSNHTTDPANERPSSRLTDQSEGCSIPASNHWPDTSIITRATAFIKISIREFLSLSEHCTICTMPPRTRKSKEILVFVYTHLIFSNICYSKLLSVQFIFFSSIRCQIYFPLEYKER